MERIPRSLHLTSKSQAALGWTTRGDDLRSTSPILITATALPKNSHRLHRPSKQAISKFQRENSSKVHLIPFEALCHRCTYCIMLMTEIRHDLGCIKPMKSLSIVRYSKFTYQTGAGFQPSTVRLLFLDSWFSLLGQNSLVKFGEEHGCPKALFDSATLLACDVLDLSFACLVLSFTAIKPFVTMTTTSPISMYVP